MGTLPFLTRELHGTWYSPIRAKNYIKNRLNGDSIEDFVITLFCVIYFCFPLPKNHLKTEKNHETKIHPGFFWVRWCHCLSNPQLKWRFFHLVKTGKDRLDRLTQGFRNQCLHLLEREKKNRADGGTSCKLPFFEYQLDGLVKGLIVGLGWFRLGLVWFRLGVFVFNLGSYERIRFGGPWSFVSMVSSNCRRGVNGTASRSYGVWYCWWKKPCTSW